ncbi:mRNA-decapping enzyme 1A isoform 2-T2 [Anomaloglossus baeobatrachus]|uniref:mRNA-decapping enzyme 1A isoform X2 n=1 Tax=Anomaloglossus baeobatrachus TaxID=238106 RepID=UPI003F503D87
MVHRSDSRAKMEVRSTVERGMSLAALRRNDPFISAIMDVTGQVALYSFSAKTNEWEKTEIEGTLFVYTRSASPRHGFTIMNRLNMNNLVEPINKDLEFQLHEPFLLYRNSSLSIYSIWFYDMNDCQRISKLMTEVVQQESEKVKTRKSPIGGPSDCSAGAIDILQMLSKAKNQYEKGQGTDSSAAVTNNPPLVKPETSERVSSSAPQEKSFHPGQKHLTVEELFGTTLPKEHQMTTCPPPDIKDPFLPDIGEHKVFLQSKPLQPVIVRAEPRSFNCSASDFSHPACLPPALIPQGLVTQLDSHNEMNSFPCRVSPCLGSSSEVLSASAPPNSSLVHTRQMSPLLSLDVGSAPQTHPLIPPLAPVRSSSFSSSSHPSVELLHKLKLNPQTGNKTAMAPKFSCTTNQLATPESFKDSSLKSLPGPLQNAHEKREAEPFAQPLGVSKASPFSAAVTTDAAACALWSPSVFQHPALKHSSQDDCSAPPPPVSNRIDRRRSCCTGIALSRLQLQETLVHLIRNDSGFLNTIHEAYVQVVTKSMDNVRL